MLKKCAILGLALLMIGGLSLAWLRKQTEAERIATPAAATDTLQSADYLQKYGHWYRLTPEQQNRLVLELDEDRKNKTPEELTAEQKARLHADLPRLAAGEMNPGDIADYLYGSGWEDEVTQYRQRREQEQITQTISVVCLSIGGALFGICFVIWLLCLVARAFKALTRRRVKRPASIDSEPTELTAILHDEPTEEEGDEDEPEIAFELPDGESDESQPVSTPSWCDPDRNDRDDGERFLVPRRHRDLPAGRPTLAIEPRPQDDAVALLMSDEPSEQQEWSAQMEWSSPTDDEYSAQTASQKQRFTPRPRVAVLGSTEILTANSPAAPVENPLTEQAEDLQRQIAEFRQMAQSVQQASRDQSEPLGSTLKELAQQVSAIREYAACQQDRVEKLQDGYDWSIVRTFCLRVIRCIDNLENRIDRLNENDESVLQLEEVRDELLFALESSGVEQYRPDIGTDYRGQEKLAEAIKEKETTREPSQVGTIAKVVRPGYRYVTDEDSYKVVRTAQVKLFG